MTLVRYGGHQGHQNPSEWKLKWQRRWTPEPPRWRWWEVAILLLIVVIVIWWLL